MNVGQRIILEILDIWLVDTELIGELGIIYILGNDIGL